MEKQTHLKTKQKILSAPRKDNFKSMNEIILGIVKNQNNYYEDWQKRFEDKSKNKILLRLMHMSDDKNEKPWVPRCFPIELYEYEYKNEYGEWRSRYHSKEIDTATAFRNLKKFFEKSGLVVNLEFKNSKSDCRTVTLTVVGIADKRSKK